MANLPQELLEPVALLGLLEPLERPGRTDRTVPLAHLEDRDSRARLGFRARAA